MFSATRQVEGRRKKIQNQASVAFLKEADKCPLSVVRNLVAPEWYCGSEHGSEAAMGEGEKGLKLLLEVLSAAFRQTGWATVSVREKGSWEHPSNQISGMLGSCKV